MASRYLIVYWRCENEPCSYVKYTRMRSANSATAAAQEVYVLLRELYAQSYSIVHYECYPLNMRISTFSLGEWWETKARTDDAPAVLSMLSLRSEKFHVPALCQPFVGKPDKEISPLEVDLTPAEVQRVLTFLRDSMPVEVGPENGVGFYSARGLVQLNHSIQVTKAL